MTAASGLRHDPAKSEVAPGMAAGFLAVNSLAAGTLQHQGACDPTAKAAR